MEFKGKILLHYSAGELNNSRVSLQVLDSRYVGYQINYIKSVAVV